jgi:ATP-dependent Lon protease
MKKKLINQKRTLTVNRTFVIMKSKNIQPPGINESLKVKGYTLNVEYFSEILHTLREMSLYSTLVGELLDIPKTADTRDTTAVLRLATAYLKLFFPHVRSIEDIDKEDFNTYCLLPAIDKLRIIRRQIHLIDQEFRDEFPDIRMKDE